jgi:hypothetical protein
VISAAKATHSRRTHISEAASGKLKMYKGFEWKFIEKGEK